MCQPIIAADLVLELPVLAQFLRHGLLCCLGLLLAALEFLHAFVIHAASVWLAVE